MKEYIEGSLANIPPAIAAQTLSAPAHNIFAEQMADHLMRKAPNITIGFVDGKVKTKLLIGFQTKLKMSKAIL